MLFIMYSIKSTSFFDYFNRLKDWAIIIRRGGGGGGGGGGRGVKYYSGINNLLVKASERWARLTRISKRSSLFKR